MSLQWMARVGLARPSASVRSFAVRLRDLCGEGSKVSRRQIGRIRDAFVQTLTELRAKELTKMVAAYLRSPASAATGAVASNAATGVARGVASSSCVRATAVVFDAATGAADVAAATGVVVSDAATGATRRIKAIVALYLHDEASLRLRSHLGGVAGLPSRSRSSKASSTSWQSSFDQIFLAGARKIWRPWQTRRLRP